MNQILEQIYKIGIIPVIAIDDPDKAVPLAKALAKGGLPAAGITFRTPAAEASIRAICKEVPEMLVGAGTVTTSEQLDCALAAGAKFIVSPGFNPDMVKYGLSKGALMLPGTATGGEMEQAMSLGLDAVKFFPAEQNGGIAKLKALAGPYRTLKWMPTGGINAKNLMDYLSFDQILACGGTWMVKKDMIENERWDEIIRLCREAESLARAVSVLLGLDVRQTSKSWFAGSAVEYMNKPGPGVKGHIGFRTNSVKRAMYHLGRAGVVFDEDTLQYNDKGEPKFVYIKGDFGGFAIHLLNR